MMINQIKQEYLQEAGKNLARTIDEYNEMICYMKSSSSVYYGEYVRTCYMPKIFSEQNFQQFSEDIHLLYKIFQKIIKHYYQNADYRKLFGFDKISEELILASKPERTFIPMSRIDFFFNENTGDYKFCEFNTDGSSGMNEDLELNKAQELSTMYKSFKQKYKVRSCELFNSWVKAVQEVYCKVRKTEVKPYVAIVDYLEHGTVNEFAVFKEFFTKAGFEIEICDVKDLVFKDGVLKGTANKKIDVIYRRAVTSDILKNYVDSIDLIEAFKADAVVLVGDFHTQIVHNKMIFAVMQHADTFAFLEDREIEFIKKHVPLTRIYKKTDNEELLKNKDSWILKPFDNYGSAGVHAGVESNQEEWASIVADLPEDGYLMQEFHTPFVTDNYGYAWNTEDVRLNKYYNLTGVFVYNGKPQGIYSRISLSKIISTQYSEKTLPTVIVDI